MASAIRVYLEVGSKRVFAAALDWPGWSRSGKTPEAALQTLVEYGARYRDSIGAVGQDLMVPSDPQALTVVEEVAGNATTDFGAPGMPVAADEAQLSADEAQRQLGILEASWAAFDATAERFGIPPGFRSGDRCGRCPTPSAAAPGTRWTMPGRSRTEPCDPARCPDSAGIGRRAGKKRAVWGDRTGCNGPR